MQNWRRGRRVSISFAEIKERKISASDHVIEDENGRVLVKEEEVKDRCPVYFKVQLYTEDVTGVDDDLQPSLGTSNKISSLEVNTVISWKHFFKSLSCVQKDFCIALYSVCLHW